MTLDADAARQLTDRIKSGLGELLPAIREAFEGRADVALGYESWSAYCDAELGGMRIPVQARADAVATLRGAGMSTRAIGSALGVSQPTVVRDLAGTDSNESVPVRGLDGGREQPASRLVPPIVSEAIRDALAEQDKRSADRKALDDLADELGLEHDAQAEADESKRIALLYPFYDAIAKLAAMPPAEDVVELIKPYERYRLDQINAVDSWVDDFARAWRKTA